jgi:3-hydroxybutyryl-CoA dehydrogenase
MPALNSNAIVAVIGAGAMGAGIAQVAAQAGRQLAKRVESGKLAASTYSACMANLQPAEAIAELADASLVIEAIVENLQVKRDLFRQLEILCSNDCILASNTSSLSITSLAAELAHPGRMVGMHFFNPAPIMALVEVVCGLASDANVAATVHATARAWGKKPVFARSTPGFIVNRVARPFYAESLRLLQEGVADCATLDGLLREAGGFRMGAFELTDLIGHDVNYAVTCSVFDAYYQDMRFQPSLIQKELVDAGHLGRKSGRGFYDYSEGAERPQATTLTSNAAVETIIVEGDLGPLAPLLARLRRHDLNIIQRDGPGLLRVGDAVLALSDGRLASQRLREDGLSNLVLLDLALDFTTATRLGISWAAGTSQLAIDQAVALLARVGIAVSPLRDSPGLCVLRTVAMLANEAADAQLQGVASAADIDLAMCAGVNYPRGPLAWADSIGLCTVATVLANLQASYGEERYRPSLQLRRQLAEGKTLHE